MPKRNSSSGKQRQGGISKQGDHSLRRLLVLGDVIRQVRTKAALDTAWLRSVLERRRARYCSVAQANKTARTISALLA